MLAEFQSRKAHRVHVRDKDLLKYLLGLVLVVMGEHCITAKVSIMKESSTCSSSDANLTP